jgi:16S rRNA (uracil1498-N3)-methyltransferase
MRIRRFKVDQLDSPIVRVTGREAGHALRVLRLRVGAKVVLFDGLGSETTGLIRSVGDSAFDVDVLECQATAVASGARLILAVAAPKGSRADWMVEKCAELGVHALWLLRCARSQVHPGSGKLARWAHKAVEAAKQAGLAAAMGLEPPRSIAAILSAVPAEARLWHADPHRPRLSLDHALGAGGQTGPAPTIDVIFVGPEGGFTEDECRLLAQAGSVTVSLCRSTLRVETAAIAAAAIWVSRSDQTIEEHANLE